MSWKYEVWIFMCTCLCTWCFFLSAHVLFISRHSSSLFGGKSGNWRWPQIGRNRVKSILDDFPSFVGEIFVRGSVQSQRSVGGTIDSNRYSSFPLQLEDGEVMLRRGVSSSSCQLLLNGQTPQQSRISSLSSHNSHRLGVMYPLQNQFNTPAPLLIGHKEGLEVDSLLMSSTNIIIDYDDVGSNGGGELWSLYS